MKTYVTDIGPSEARMFLEGNLNNRKIDKRTVAKYSREMREGRWETNGSSISIFDDGKSICLLNGQHRLLAVVETGVTITVVIVEEDSPKVFGTLDVGKNRQTAQILNLAGVLNSNTVQAIARANILLQEEGNLAWDRSNSRTITAAEILDWHKDQDDVVVQKATHLYQEARRLTKATNTWYACLAYEVFTRSPNSSRFLELHHNYSTGLDMKEGSPVYALRQYTINRAGPRAGVQSTFDRQAHLGIGLRAWNDFLSGREVAHYRFSRRSLPMPVVN